MWVRANFGVAHHDRKINLVFFLKKWRVLSVSVICCWRWYPTLSDRKKKQLNFFVLKRKNKVLRPLTDARFSRWLKPVNLESVVVVTSRPPLIMYGIYRWVLGQKVLPRISFRRGPREDIKKPKMLKGGETSSNYREENFLNSSKILLLWKRKERTT